MHDLYKVRDMLVNELKEFGKKGELSKTSLDAINKLSHAAKNVCKVIDYCEQEEYDYSNAMSRAYDSYSRDGGNSYKRSYSRAHEDVKDHLRRLMDNANDERVREELRRMIDTF